MRGGRASKVGILAKDIHETELGAPLGPLIHRLSIFGKNPLIKFDNGRAAIAARKFRVTTLTPELGSELDETGM